MRTNCSMTVTISVPALGKIHHPVRGYRCTVARRCVMARCLELGVACVLRDERLN